jgi:hypothetical protein
MFKAAISGWGGAEDAAKQHDGGARSFTLQRQQHILPQYGYRAPDEQYQRLFWRAAAPTTRRSTDPTHHSAGWLVSDDPSECKPVFIAHSLQSAIWLLRKMLPEYTLPDYSWDSLTFAAFKLTRDEDPEENDNVPHSAQKPRDTPSSATKRAAEATQTEASKRAKTVDSTSSDQNEHRQSEDEDEDEGEGELAAVTTTVTNNNRRAERRRELQLEKQALQKKQSLGLVQPLQSALATEKAAYNSIAPDDEHTISWILKQSVRKDNTNFYNATEEPYITATAMLQKARVLGNSSAQRHAAAFLHNWRRCGNPFPTHSIPTSSYQPTSTSSEMPTQPRLPNKADDALRFTWRLVSECEDAQARADIQYRWAMAFLGRAYADKIAQLQQEDDLEGRALSRGRGGKGQLRSEAIAAILPIVGDITARIDRNTVRKRIYQANRWYEAADNLGWGFLCLIPADSVPHTWVERLRSGEWRVWLELVKMVNRDVYTASQALDAWLGSESIAGGSIEGKDQLCIESAPPAAIFDVEEVADSEDEDEPSSSPAEAQAVHSSAEPAQQLRQLTLPELFKPRERLQSRSQSVSSV